MAKNSINNELFSATNLFNNLTKEFRERVELKNHNRRLKSYKNSFIAHKGVSFLFDLLKSDEEFSAKIQHRDQVINLMNIFLKWGIIVKIYPSNNLHKFQDNKDLYTLGESEENEKKKEPTFEHISKSTNDLIGSNAGSFRPDRSSMYRSFGKSTYNQFNQLQDTIKKTTSAIIKSTNQSTWMNVTKFANHTLNKLSNKSGNNVTKKSNDNFIKKSSNPIKRSTSAITKSTINKSFAPINTSLNTPYSRPITRSVSQQEKENYVMNNFQKFERNYRGYLNTTNRVNQSLMSQSSNYSILPVNSSLNSQVPINVIQPNIQSVSLNPMNEDICMKCIEQDGNNLIKFLTKISDGLKKKPLRPTNTTLSNMTSVPQIVNKDQVYYLHNLPNIQQLQSNIYRPNNYTSFHSGKTCSNNPISSTCYNTLV